MSNTTKKPTPTAFRIPEDVKRLLPAVARAEQAPSPHAYAVEAISNRVRRAAKRHGITAPEGREG